MTGIGSFNKECRTLYVTGVSMGTDGIAAQKEATVKIYNLFSPWGEIEDVAFSTKGLRGGNRAFIKFAHRYSSEFAREAMSDQMEVFEGQKDPLVVRWAVEGSGNPFDFQSEAQKASREITELKATELSRRRRMDMLAQAPADEHKKMTIDEKLKIDSKELLPQLSSLNKRQEKH